MFEILDIFGKSDLEIVDIDKEDYAIDKASTYVVDFDNEFL